MNGGYIMVDCLGLDINDLGTVAGLFDKLVTAFNTRKNVILEHIENDGYMLSPTATVITPQENGNYHFSVDNIVLNITSGNVVTAVNANRKAVK